MESMDILLAPTELSDLVKRFEVLFLQYLDQQQWLITPYQQLTIHQCEFHPDEYQLTLQDYFMKWAEAIPMPNQTAECIAGILSDLFSRFGIPEILHSDQGANFESTMIRRV